MTGWKRRVGDRAAGGRPERRSRSTSGLVGANQAPRAPSLAHALDVSCALSRPSALLCGFAARVASSSVGVLVRADGEITLPLAARDSSHSWRRSERPGPPRAPNSHNNGAEQTAAFRHKGTQGPKSCCSRPRSPAGPNRPPDPGPNACPMPQASARRSCDRPSSLRLSVWPLRRTPHPTALMSCRPSSRLLACAPRSRAFARPSRPLPPRANPTIGVSPAAVYAIAACLSQYSVSIAMPSSRLWWPLVKSVAGSREDRNLPT